MRSTFARSVLLLTLLASPAASADPSLEDLCAQMEGVCRDLSDGDRAAYGQVLIRLMEALPLPSESRFQRTELRSLGQFGAIPEVNWDRSSKVDELVASTLTYPKAVAYRSGGSFPQAFGIVDSFAWRNGGGAAASFSKLAKLQPGEPPYDLRIEAIGLPVGFFPALEKGSKVLEKKKDQFAFETMKDGDLEYVLLLGPRAAEASEAEPTWAAPPQKLDGVGGLMVRITGPANEVRALSKKLNVKALSKFITQEPPKAAADAGGGDETSVGTAKIQEVRRK
ncbi:MAG: hypothetical protein ACK4N5_03075, partial [Myxococcales bacterium]